MIRKLLEAFFRHKLLLLLPPILITGIATPIAVASVPVSYDASIGVWVDRPAYFSITDPSTAYLSPAQLQANRLVELLRTRGFPLEVAKRTSLAPLLGSAIGEARIESLFGSGVSVGKVGDHVLVVSATATTAQIAYELCTAVVDAYQEKVTSDAADQSAVAVSFYQAQQQDADQKVAKTSQDLRRYLSALSANSDVTGANDPTLADPRLTPVDPKLAALQASLQEAQSASGSARAAVAAAQRDAAVSVQGQQLAFQVIDPARMPTTAIRPLKKIIVYPIAALVIGLGLSAILLVMMVAGDRSVRSESEVAPGLRVLGVVPFLTLKRVPKPLRGVATRRAIGALAGMALPAPARSR